MKKDRMPPQREDPEGRKHLGQFLGVYFNQDQDVLWGEPDEAVSAFLDGEPRHYVRATADEIDELLRTAEDDAALERELADLGSEIEAWRDPGAPPTARAWLEHLLTRLREEPMDASSG